MDMLRTSIFLPQSVYPEILRETTLAIVGAGLHGNIDLNKAGGLSYGVAIGTQNIDASERIKQAFMDTQSSNDAVQTDSIDVDSKYAVSLLWEPPLEGLKISWTIGNTKFTTESHATADFMDWLKAGTKIYQKFDKFQYNVYSSEYTRNDLTLAGEYMKTERLYAMGEGAPDLSMDNATAKNAKGWYASASYRFTDWFVLGTYYSKTKTISAADGAAGPGGDAGAGGGTSSEDMTGRAYQNDLCLSTRFDINEYMVFKLEGHTIKGTNGMSPLDNPADAGGKRWTEKWKMFAAKVTFSF